MSIINPGSATIYFVVQALAEVKETTQQRGVYFVPIDGISYVAWLPRATADLFQVGDVVWFNDLRLVGKPRQSYIDKLGISHEYLLPQQTVYGDDVEFVHDDKVVAKPQPKVTRRDALPEGAVITR